MLPIDAQNVDLQKLEELAQKVSADGGNEAETRHKVIDTIIHDLLAWPQNRVSVEEYIRPGFADYVLKKSNGDDILFIEAKKEGFYFELPIPHKKNETSCFLSLEKLLSNANVKQAVLQVREYCIDSGCEYAAITNGHQWIFFKIFEKGKRWDKLQAFVIRNLGFFRQEYTKAVNQFSYVAIIEKSSLSVLLTSASPKDRQAYFAKERIDSYSHSVNSNRLAGLLRPIAKRLFGVIDDGQSELMDRCYVSERDYTQADAGMKALIQDSLTPYFEGYGIEQLDDTGKGGRLGGRLTKNVKHRRGGEVLVLFGGKGAGKSTFIRRLLHHTPPKWLKDHSAIVIIDLLQTPDDRDVVRKVIWDDLVSALDSENLLSSDRDTILNDLFLDRFEVAQKQDLAGLSKSSEIYNTKLNDLVKEWKEDKNYCAVRLSRYWEGKGKGVIVVVDNTDQFSGGTQDFCFSSAQEICEHLNCITLISMREERFYNSKVHGILDAFQNSGFHISSPKPSSVFKKRLEYTISLLRDENRRAEITSSNNSKLINDACRYFELVLSGFAYSNSHLNTFLTACGHGDIRLSLDLFNSFLLSGYTNVDEMLDAGNWVFQIHQVVKPVMIPTRYFYDEEQSDLPNIFQIRDKRNCSHFTGLRILRKLKKGGKGSLPSFFNVAELRAYFSETFQMVGDLELNLDILLKQGFIEADNRLDCYDDSLDKVRITSYGQYMYNDLAYYFTYIDLVSIDCGVFDEGVSNYLSEAAKKEYKLFIHNRWKDRITARLDRVEKFIDYLQEEEIRENREYGLGIPPEELFTARLKSDFSDERKKVETSSNRQALKKTGRSSKKGKAL